MRKYKIRFTAVCLSTLLGMTAHAQIIDRQALIEDSASQKLMLNFQNVFNNSIEEPLTTFTEYQNRACPPNQDEGEIIVSRLVSQNAETGQIISKTAWQVASNTCDYITYVDGQNDILGTRTETQTQACPAGQLGTITQSRTYTLMRNGQRLNYSSWTTTSNNCAYAPKSAKYLEFKGYCQRGVTGGAGIQTVICPVLNTATNTFMCRVTTKFTPNEGGGWDTKTFMSKDYTDPNVMITTIATCKVSNNDKTIELMGNCSRTGGGDGDFCQSQTARLTITNESSDKCVIEYDDSNKRYSFNVCK